MVERGPDFALSASAFALTGVGARPSLQGRVKAAFLEIAIGVCRVRQTVTAGGAGGCFTR
jgi:hypothetical protein